MAKLSEIIHGRLMKKLDKAVQRDERDRKRREAGKRKRRNRKFRVIYAATVEQAEYESKLCKEARRLQKKTERERAKEITKLQPLLRALNIQDDLSIEIFLKIREMIPAALVSTLVQGGFLRPEQTGPALAYLWGSQR